MATPVRVAIIGTGFSGIAAAVELQRKGIDDFVMFEQAPALGGTWFYNRYPGAEVDLESHIYSFSYERYNWSRTHVDWSELLGYLNYVAAKHRLIEHMRFNEAVEDVTWSDEARQYTVTTSSGKDHGAFTAVISAVGFLNIPLIPPFARGDHDFQGDICHTSRWIEGLQMAGKKVGVVGTGSSAVQIVTEAEKVASEVKIFQLEPNWILPKDSRKFSATELRFNQFAPVYWYRRLRLYFDYDKRQITAGHARANGKVNRLRYAKSLAFLHRELGSRPDLLEMATPKFPFEGRRTVLSDTYYNALKSPHVTLVPHGVKGLTKQGAIDANGDEHELDLIVLATGFDASNYLGNFEVHGEGGADLHEQWAGEPEALLGLMVPNFPNFFIMYGPNTNSVPLVSFYQAQAKFAAGSIAKLRNKSMTRIRVRERAFDAYNKWLQDQLSKTVWADTANYFRAKSGKGKIVSQWPLGATPYLLATKLFRRIGTHAD
ncbi:putative flavin-containing monooxygenase [Gordonia namibiensis NBRC 108229]|uniref:Putative flavin-containing monooxygenase n=1 Tax=Gordonia namibiensis NBRC 108229 TaxID=1208314 RepID=K6X4H9_9ACTN|nr:NAD(P)/FAD-dependent oxidoreductase [Gordonia namibiensis]GAC00982.1 putative flavin-containing monooxygenase [Gordonia namibiensis NBRC 108229]